MAGVLQLRAANGRAYTIDAPVRVGRDQTCQIRLDDGQVSRVHATVWPEGAALRIRDEGSSNGTFFNGERLEPGRIFNMRVGDTVRIGDSLLTVEPAPQPAARPEAFQPAGPAPVPPPPSAAERAPVNSPPTVNMRVQPRPAPAPAAAPPPTRRRSPLPMVALGGGLVVCVLLVCAGGGLYASQRPPLLQTALAQIAPGDGSGGVGTPDAPATLAPEAITLTILPAEPLPMPLSPEAFVANQESLAVSVAELNMAQLVFIHKMLGQARGPVAHISRPLPQAAIISDEDFAFIERKAIKVYIQANQQGQTVASQGNGNDPVSQAMAEVYAALAQQALIVTLKVNDLRQQWNSGTLDLPQLAAQMAQASSALWNPAVTEPATPGNPFAAYAANPGAVTNPVLIDPAELVIVGNEPGLGPNPTGWVAVAPAMGSETLTLPPLVVPLPEPLAPSVLSQLFAPGNPLNADALAQVAAAALVQSSGQPGQPPSSVTIPLRPVVVADPKAAAASGATLPSFPGGNTVVIIPAPSGNGPVGTLFGLDGNNDPTVHTLVPIEETPPLVTITISNLTIKQINKRPKDAFNTFEADVVYEFDVKWTTNLTAPQFTLDCVSGNHFDITSVSGTHHISAKGLLILYPGAEDAYCYASRNGNTLGSASIHFLVGDAAEATQRAIQVETDSVSLDLTLTADAQGTADTKLTQAAGTLAAQQTENAVGTEVAGTQTAEFKMTVTALAGSEGLFATQTAAALEGDVDGDGVTGADDRCPQENETRNNWRDQDGCPDKLPVVNLSAVFTEKLTNGPVGAFASTANVTIDFSGGTFSGTATGSGSWSGTYTCFNTSDPSEIYQTVGASYTASYTAQVGGPANGASGTFEGTLAATGVTHIALNEAFTHEECTHLNSANRDDHWFGGGAVSGTWDFNTFATLSTDWSVEAVLFAGTWSGSATATEP